MPLLPQRRQRCQLTHTELLYKREVTVKSRGKARGSGAVTALRYSGTHAVPDARAALQLCRSRRAPAPNSSFPSRWGFFQLSNFSSPGTSMGPAGTSIKALYLTRLQFPKSNKGY